MFEIGNSLREARVRQGLGYPELELATKIRAKYLRALEDEEFSILPGDTYIKGFLRTYADHLGLDGQLYVDEYTSRFALGLADEPLLQRQRPRVRQRTVERRGVLLALLGIAVLAALVIVAWKFGGSSPTSTPASTPRVAAPAALTLVGVGKGSYVVIRQGEASGPLLLQGTIEGGSRQTLTGRRFYLFARDPGLLRITLGGRPVSLPAARNLRVLVTPSRTTRLAG
ncbi:MAG: helix-turn-helix domain-containing protein [Actinobacteria bacterium]|nr:helix-turn-helix domain-containing protein [Actinomycetota bacterium]